MCEWTHLLLVCVQVLNCLPMPGCSINKTSRPQQSWIRKDACPSYRPIQTAYTPTHRVTEREIYIYVCLTLLKSLVSVKLNLGIIITSKTTGSYLSSLAPPQRYRGREWSHWCPGPCMMDSLRESCYCGLGGVEK